MELNAEGRDVGVSDAFNCSVVNVEKRYFCVRRKRGVFYCIAVVLACDVDAACFGVFAGMVYAAVSVFEFACFTAAGQGQHLVSKAYAEDWDRLILRVIVGLDPTI